MNESLECVCVYDDCNGRLHFRFHWFSFMFFFGLNFIKMKNFIFQTKKKNNNNHPTTKCESSLSFSLLSPDSLATIFFSFVFICYCGCVCVFGGKECVFFSFGSRHLQSTSRPTDRPTDQPTKHPKHTKFIWIFNPKKNFFLGLVLVVDDDGDFDYASHPLHTHTHTPREKETRCSIKSGK